MSLKHKSEGGWKDYGKLAMVKISKERKNKKNRKGMFKNAIILLKLILRFMSLDICIYAKAEQGFCLGGG